MKQFSRPSLRKWWRGQTLSKETSMVNVLLLVSQTYAKVTFQVIIGMREFRSTLPFLLHRSNLFMIPRTLTIGDYILTPEICVERKSLLNLILSFNSGRLSICSSSSHRAFSVESFSLPGYTQCELISQHHKHSILLIEFEEDKAFTLDIRPAP